MSTQTDMIELFPIVFFFKQKTAYEMRISDWSSDVCSSDLRHERHPRGVRRQQAGRRDRREQQLSDPREREDRLQRGRQGRRRGKPGRRPEAGTGKAGPGPGAVAQPASEARPLSLSKESYRSGRGGREEARQQRRELGEAVEALEMRQRLDRRLAVALGEQQEGHARRRRRGGVHLAVADIGDGRELHRQQAGHLAQRRSEEHTSELQSLMRTSYAVFCLKKKNNTR